MTPEQATQLIETFAPPALQAEWDQSGPQILGDRREIHKIAVGLDPTPALVQAALAWGADFILVHHPLTLSPLRLDRRDDRFLVVQNVLRAGAWLYAAHTSLDVSPTGAARFLADALGLVSPKPLEPVAADKPDFGYGFIGRLAAPMPPEAVRDLALSALGLHAAVAFGSAPDMISTVASCPGSGGSFLPKVQALGVDLYITGDVKYHQFLDNPVWTLDVGHFAYEEVMTRRFAKTLADACAERGVKVQHFPGADPRSIVARTVSP